MAANAKVVRRLLGGDIPQAAIEGLAELLAALAIDATPDATTGTKGKLQLAGDLAGTASAPTVPGLAAKANDDAVVKLTGDQTAAGNKTWNGSQWNRSGDPVYHVKGFGPWSTPAERRTTIAAAMVPWAATGGDLVFPPGEHDLSGGTVTMPDTAGWLHFQYNLVGKNTVLMTTTAHPILSDSLPANNTAAVTRTNRQFSGRGISFLGTGLVGQVGLRLIGTYSADFRRCNFRSLEDGLDLIFCMNPVLESCNFFNSLNHDVRFRYGMEIDNGLATRTAMWSGAAETNSNGNCPKISKCRGYATAPGPQRTVTNKAITSNVVTLTTSVDHGFTVGRWVYIAGLGSPYDGVWKVQSTPTTTTFTYNRTNADVASTAVTTTDRTVADMVTNGTTTITSATADFRELDRGSGISGTNIPAGATITIVTSPTTAVISAAATGSGTGGSLTINRRCTAQMGQRAQICFEGISEIIAEGLIDEGSTPLYGILYDQGASTTAKGIEISALHAEQQPLVAHIGLVGTGGGHVVVRSGNWTQGATVPGVGVIDNLCIVDASLWTTGFVHVQFPSSVRGKFREKASSQVVWCFDVVGGAGYDPTSTSNWDGPVPLYFAPHFRTAISTKEAGFANAGVLAFKNAAAYSCETAHTFFSADVSPKITFKTTPGVSIAMWNAAANPATLANNTLFFWNDITNARLQLVVKDNAGTTFTIPISHAVPGILAGTGTPEGSKTASVGTIYMRTDGGAGTSFYVKESGSGNTGWVAK